MHSIKRPLNPAAPPLATSRWQRIGPILALLLLAPVVSEVLYGGTRVSVIFVLIPEIMTWGCGALLIRECVRRWHKGWQSMLLLGLALAVAEECVIQQTSIAPLVGLAAHAYGRVWGVNWVYFLWAAGYESVWVVLVPVQLTELLFPARREQLWLRGRGVLIASTVFVLGACMAWYSWTQMARVKIFHMPPYSPPPLYSLTAVAAILLLILAAYALPSYRRREGHVASRTAPRPWFVGLVICALDPLGSIRPARLWFRPHRPVQTSSGRRTCLGRFHLSSYATMDIPSPNWRDAHRFALVFGGVLACMIGGFVVFKVGGALRIDWIGKAVLNATAVAWLISLGGTVKRREVA